MEHAGAALIAWLLGSLTGPRSSPLPEWAAWHGRLMVLAWSLLLPVGAMIARFGKVPDRRRWPAELNRVAWWHLHRAIQWVGLAVMGLALAIVWPHAGTFTGVALVHRVFGWSVVAFGVFQLAAALARGTRGGHLGAALRGDHFDMTRRRVLFEWSHKTAGWLVMPVAMATTGLGLGLADAPRWMAVLIGLWWVALIALFVALQRRGFCVDTYQAIWGDDPSLPGNRRRPIGFGVTRGRDGKMPGGWQRN